MMLSAWFHQTATSRVQLQVKQRERGQEEKTKNVGLLNSGERSFTSDCADSQSEIKLPFLLPQKGNGPGVAPNQSSQFAAPSSLRPLYLRSHALGSDREKEKKDRWHKRLEMRFLCGAAGLTRRKRVQQTERTAAVSSCCAFDLTGALVEVVRARVNPEHTGESTDPELYEDGGGITSKRLCQNLYHCPW